MLLKTTKTMSRNCKENVICVSKAIRNCGGCIVLDSKAFTKIQTVALIAIIVMAAIAGSAAYIFWVTPTRSTENIIIGVVGDLDMGAGRSTLRGVTLAAEQINATGGILGRNITIVSEDDDSETPPNDIAIAETALTKLITVDKVDYIISTGGFRSQIAYPFQDIVSEHKKIMLTTTVAADELTQRVLDNYDKYKYIFRVTPTNASTASTGMLEGIITLGNYTGFTKVALIFQDYTSAKTAAADLKNTLPDHGFQLVYSTLVSTTVMDFTSYFTAAEAAGAEIIAPYITGAIGGSFVKEWYERQSPTVLWGVLTEAGKEDFWNVTEGKCDTISFPGSPAVSGYPLTNKTLPTREAYVKRWGEVPNMNAVGAYDALRFILADAIKRAGTTETEAVIKTLETTNVETSSARHFVFTSSHDVMVGSDTPNNPAENYMVVMNFQWQNGTQVPMTPQGILKEIGATYKYPYWSGPWSKTSTP
jgi:branched-chain amino acid transport system substrate-binding protein